MKKLLLTTLSFVTLSVFAQIEVNISMATGYSQDVFVSMANGEVSTVNAVDWDIAFDVRSAFSNTIRLNDGQEKFLKVYPNGDIEDWADVDSTGYATWSSLTNRTDAWSNGAFNISGSGDPSDFSWGYYTGDPLHDVVGDSIYLIQTAEETVKKLRIDLLDSGSWTFTFANLDGSGETSHTFAMEDYPDKNFVYFDLDSDSFIDREPLNTDWDLVFHRYWALTAFGPGATAGCLSNAGVEVIQADGIDTETVSFEDYTWVTDDISVIGNDWKELNEMFSWDVVEERAYFVKDLAGDIYKIVFSSFGGSGTGDIPFNVELMSGVGVEENGNLTFTNIYPNPASNGFVNLQLDLRSAQDLNLQITDSFGRVVVSENLNLAAGLNQHRVDTSSLTAGMYLVVLEENGVPSQTLRLVIK